MFSLRHKDSSTALQSGSQLILLGLRLERVMAYVCALAHLWTKNFFNLCEDSENPPTAVGGLFRSFLQRTRPAAQKSHPRQWDGSDPFYKELDPLHRNPTHGSGWMVQILSTKNSTCCTEIPPTGVGGWFRSG